MTGSTPAIVETVSDQSSALADQRTALRELITAIDDYQIRVENLSSSQQELFYESVSGLRDEVATADDPTTLLDLRDDIDAAVRSPLEQVAQESLVGLLGHLQPDLTDAERQQTVSQLKSKIPAELETVTDVYQTLTGRVVDLDPVRTDLLAEAIEADPSTLQRPQTDLVPVADQLENRYETLTMFEADLRDSDWAPPLDLTGIPGFYRDDPATVDRSALQSHLTAVDDGLTTLETHGFELEAVLQETVADAAETADLSELADTLEEAAHFISEAADSYVTVAAFMDSLETATETPDEFEAEIAALQQSFLSVHDHEYATLGHLLQSVEDMADDVDAFVGRLHKRLAAQHEFITELGAEDDAASLSDLELGSSPTIAQVNANPSAALADCATLNEWVTAQVDVDSDAVDRAELVELWQSLAQGKAIDLTAENQQTVLVLADHLSVQAVLQN